ncbi:MAG: Hsp70 family protein [Pirellulales bacterium]|nr:Hsp70 family protein [Pirellulales bacterium]
MARQYPVGIDLGTTFSTAAWVNESGQTEIIRNSEGELLTPSVVLFEDRELVVGKEARTATTVHPELVAEWVKRDMGLPYYSRPIHGRRLPPEVIQACILRKLKEDIVFELGGVGRVVITVPAYFDEPRRKRTADAGEMAGLKVLDIVNEPTAAALSFGETLGCLAADGEPKEEMTLLVYDLGGGTFDATLLRLAPGKIETVATDGDVMLGGHDWDLRLVDHVAQRFKKLHKRDPREDPVIINRALAAAVEAKHALSARTRTIMHIEVAGQTVEVPVTRRQFEEMTADLLERTAYTTRQLLASAKLQWKDVSRVLLVGGSTRMPMVGRMLRELSGREPDHSVNPDEAVARGAALFAAYLLDKESGGRPKSGLTITNVNSHGLGVEGIDPETMRKKNVVLIPRNTPLPAKFTERFVTRSENQRSIAVQILEGESSAPDECTAIGRTVVRDLPEGLPKNWPVEIAFEYAENGRLTVTADVPGTHRGAVLEIERSVGFADDDLARWQKPIDEAAGFDAFESMVQEVMEQSADGRNAEMTPEEIESMQAEFGGPGAGPARPGGWTPFVAGPNPEKPGPEREPPPQTEDESLVAGGSHRIRSVARQRLPRWVGLIGHVIAAMLGLTLGYLILCQLRPDTFPFPFSW